MHVVHYLYMGVYGHGDWPQAALGGINNQNLIRNIMSMPLDVNLIAYHSLSKSCPLSWSVIVHEDELLKSNDALSGKKMILQEIYFF